MLRHCKIKANKMAISFKSSHIRGRKETVSKSNLFALQGGVVKGRQKFPYLMILVVNNTTKSATRMYWACPVVGKSRFVSKRWYSICGHMTLNSLGWKRFSSYDKYFVTAWMKYWCNIIDNRANTSGVKKSLNCGLCSNTERATWVKWKNDKFRKHFYLLKEIVNVHIH